MMAEPPRPLRWASCPDKVVSIPMVYVRHHGTEAERTVLGPAPSITVCRDCRRSEELCRCDWRKP